MDFSRSPFDYCKSSPANVDLRWSPGGVHMEYMEYTRSPDGVQVEYVEYTRSLEGVHMESTATCGGV